MEGLNAARVESGTNNLTSVPLAASKLNNSSQQSNRVEKFSKAPAMFRPGWQNLIVITHGPRVQDTGPGPSQAFVAPSPESKRAQRNASSNVPADPTDLPNEENGGRANTNTGCPLMYPSRTQRPLPTAATDEGGTSSGEKDNVDPIPANREISGRIRSNVRPVTDLTSVRADIPELLREDISRIIRESTNPENIAVVTVMREVRRVGLDLPDQRDPNTISRAWQTDLNEVMREAKRQAVAKVSEIIETSDRDPHQIMLYSSLVRAGERTLGYRVIGVGLSPLFVPNDEEGLDEVWYRDGTSLVSRMKL